MIYTTDKYCYKLFSLSVCNSQAGSGAREFTLHHILVSRADSNALWWWQQPFQEAGSVIPISLVNAVYSWTVQTPANEGAIFATVKQEQWRWIDWGWFRDCTVPMHLGLNWQALCAQSSGEVHPKKLSFKHLGESIPLLMVFTPVSRCLSSTPTLYVTVTIPWFYHLILCAIWWWCTSQKPLSEEICHIKLWAYFLTGNLTVETLCSDFSIFCMILKCIVQWIWFFCKIFSELH